MKKYLYITIPLLLLAVFLSLYFLPLSNLRGRLGGGFNNSPDVEAAAVSSIGLTLDLKFGNNNGAATPTVYDSSGFARHATSTAGTTAPTCGGKFCNFDGGDYMTANGSNVLNSASISYAIKFTPTWSPNDGANHWFWQAPVGSNYYGILKSDSTVALIYFTNDLGSIWTPLSSYSQYWKKNQENILIFSSTSGNSKAWFNGFPLTVNGSTTAWSPANPSNLAIGADATGASKFSGKLHYLKVWNRLLTDAEVGILSADRTAKSASAPMASSTPTSSGRLVGHWTMDANDINGTNVYDKSGQNNNGTGTNITSADLVAGKIGNALDFDGSSEHITVTRTASLESANITLSTWIKPTSLTGRLFNKGINALESYLGYSFIISDATNVLIQMYGATSGLAQMTIAHQLRTNEWAMLTMTYDGTTTKLYKNGIFLNQSTSANGNITHSTTENLYVGSYLDGTGVFNGKMDDVRIYNYALSAQEVTQLYTAAKKNYTSSAPMDGLVGHWTMDANDINGTTVYDKSGNKNNLNGTNITSADIVAGKINQAFDLDGSTEYFSRGALSPTISDNGPASLSAWIKLDQKASTKGSLQPIMHNLLFLHNANDYFYIIDDYSSCGLLGARVGQWMHLVLTWSGNASTAKLYIDNGTPCMFSQQGGTWETMSFSTFLIGYNSSVNSFFDGSIDDVRIYNRALSPSEVSQLYQSAKKSYIR